MQRIIILKNTSTGEELTLPVTPPSYPMAAGRAVETMDMATTGQIALPGLRTLFKGTLEFMLPAREYPFLTPGAVATPQYYLDKLLAWSDAGDVCRYIVTGTAINAAVLLGQMDYGEDDGTNDVNCKLPLYEFRYLTEATVQSTGNKGRPAEPDTRPAAAKSYVVKRGDCLWTICRRHYGEATLCWRLATANNIKNPNLIYVGQVLTMPDRAALTGYAPTMPKEV